MFKGRCFRISIPVRGGEARGGACGKRQSAEEIPSGARGIECQREEMGNGSMEGRIVAAEERPLRTKAVGEGLARNGIDIAKLGGKREKALSELQKGVLERVANREGETLVAAGEEKKKERGRVADGRPFVAVPRKKRNIGQGLPKKKGGSSLV